MQLPVVFTLLEIKFEWTTSPRTLCAHQLLQQLTIIWTFTLRHCCSFTLITRTINTPSHTLCQELSLILIIPCLLFPCFDSLLPSLTSTVFWWRLSNIPCFAAVFDNYLHNLMFNKLHLIHKCFVLVHLTD